MKTLVDYMTAEDFETYKELETKAEAAKAALPPTGRKLTLDEKIANAEKKLAEFRKMKEELSGMTDAEVAAEVK